MRPRGRQFGLARRVGAVCDAAERWLEAEREQLPLWLPVAFGAGVAWWFAAPTARDWAQAAIALAGVGLAAAAFGRTGRVTRAIAIGAFAAMLGIGAVWSRAERVAAPVLTRPSVVQLTGRVEALEQLGARELVRLTIRPSGQVVVVRGRPVALPPRVRVNLPIADAPASLVENATVKLQVRLMPPAPPPVPGAYDFGQAAWFSGIGASGRGSGPVAVTGADGRQNSIRGRLTHHIEERLPGSRGGIAAALVTGDEGAISLEDADAMRRAGLAHLLSVSGLHITAVVAATMLVMLRLLALSPWLAARVRLPLVAAIAGAAAAIGYTLLTGSQVPTIRSCVAALLVLLAIALGRQALTLRLVATGALIVLVIRPESLAGPSFQLSFAAITAIVSFHEHPRVAAWFGPHEEAAWRRWLRSLGSLLITGLMVEAALMPIAVYHFHKAGLYGAGANIVAIPLTTFVIMPLEAAALLLDTAGLGAPVWWLTGKAIALLLALATHVAAAPGAVAALPAMPVGAFAAMVIGGLWVLLWRTRGRWLGTGPIVAGAIWALVTPAPDLLVTGDGRHLALRMASGDLALLRDRAGDYTRDMLAENGGLNGEPLALAEQHDARCSRDLCVADVARNGRRWRILATRSAYPVPWQALIDACSKADVVVSERTLPRGCRPRWLRLDRDVLQRTGGIALTFGNGRIETVVQPGDEHPWRVVSAASGARRQTKQGFDKLSPNGSRYSGSNRSWTRSDRHRRFAAVSHPDREAFWRTSASAAP